MKKTIIALGLALVSVAGLWALFLDLAMLFEQHGLVIAVVGFVLAPVTYLVVPWYVWLSLGNALPLIVGYGSMAVALWLAWVGLAERRRTD